jgi:hypothetical protein
MVPICPLHKPVRVREYTRFKRGRVEQVATHCRRWPRTPVLAFV